MLANEAFHAFHAFHPIVARWFTDRFGSPTEPQALGWPAILAGEDTLIAAPTGSGKTLAAFLACIDRLVRRGLAGELSDRTAVLYVSPLKALGNDIHKNLEVPLSELRDVARAMGLALPAIRTDVRTGDSTAAHRRRIARKPPHLLMTTPESLYLLLTSESGRALLGGVSTVIVDEIHAVARDKRGAHLALSLERLDALTGARPARIGLSATQRPIEEIARFLVGAKRVDAAGVPKCRIVDTGHRRPLDIAIELPDDELQAVASKELWSEIHDRVAALVRGHRTTLVFVNTRRQVERVSHALAARLGEEAVAAHHGSLSKAIRLSAEERLKSGSLRAVVATASLELGIDVGAVDLVVQLESPRSLSVGLQRIGRSGHAPVSIGAGGAAGGAPAATPKARIFPVTRDQLVECAAFVRGVRAGALEETLVPSAPIDILAQQIVASAACEELDEDALFARCRGAWPYRSLPRAVFDDVVAFLSEGVARRGGRAGAGAHLHRDAVHRRIAARRGARLVALTCGGAIPDNANYAVVADPDETVVGSLDEDFAIESLAGDIFLLGNESWRIRRVEASKVRVENAHGAPPTVPFWNGEAPGRSRELSAEVARLRRDLEPWLDHGDPADSSAREWLVAECALPAAGADHVVAYLRAGREALGGLPTQETLVAERFFDEAGGMQLVVHSPYGARINRALGLALRKRFCVTFDFELQAAAGDDGVLLSLGPQHSFPLESVFDMLSPGSLEEVLTQSVLASPMFGARWRWNATRALAVLRHQNGKRVPPNLLRMRAEDLLAGVFPAQVACQENATGPIEIPDHPLVVETVQNCLREALDTDGLIELVERIRRGEVRVVARDLPEPSVLSHEIINSKPYTYLDDAPLEERRARAVSLRRTLPSDARALGALDPEAIRTVSREVFPVVRDPNELHDALLTLVVFPERGAPAAWAAHMDALGRDGRAARIPTERGSLWVATERLENARAIFPSDVGREAGDADRDIGDSVLAVVRGWICCSGPTTVASLAARLGIGVALVERAMIALEVDGLVLRGQFLPAEAAEAAETPETEWCERGVLARIHRLTLGRLRREIEPVSAADYLRFLFRWQHVARGTQLHGTRGLSEVIGQLQGFQVAASAWEASVLGARVARYDERLLDQLCAEGDVAWGRLWWDRPAPMSSDGTIGEDDLPRGLSVAPNRATPVALVRRDDLPWLLDAAGRAIGAVAEEAGEVLALLATRGALFFDELRAHVGATELDLEEMLWALVAAGAITSDGFGAVRVLAGGAGNRLDDRRPRIVTGGRPRALKRAGRWSLLRPAGHATSPARGATPAWLERLAEQYLQRYGVVFRDVLAREPRPPPWRELLEVYRRREARGEVRGGRFVSGFSGEQFALPGAVEALRAVRRLPRDGERVEVSGVDPLNLVGILTPGARVAAIAGNRVVYVDGVPNSTGVAQATA